MVGGIRENVPVLQGAGHTLGQPGGQPGGHGLHQGGDVLLPVRPQGQGQAARPWGHTEVTSAGLEAYRGIKQQPLWRHLAA